ncbi:MAG TPA: hypothetical protein VFQ61_24050 [Polyangiaceae bacterium]|nr:hypothetical protein [Polyangiaceae bacterium]
MDAIWRLMPPAAWAAFCLALAGVYARFWPRPLTQAGQTEMLGSGGLGRVRYLVLRWFHSLVWLLLALAVVLRGEDQHTWAVRVATAALVVYVVFIVFSTMARRRERSASGPE